MAEGQIQQAQRTSERLRKLYELALTVSGKPTEVFDRIVHIIADLFGSRIAMVERLEGDKIVTLSMYLDGKIMHEGVFDLRGSPCAAVRETGLFCTFNGAAAKFPEDSFLRDFDVDSYVGMPVRGSSGDVIALITAMDSRPMNVAEEDRLFLTAMASRVRLELEREDQAAEARIVRTLLEIDHEMSRLRDLDDTLNLIVDRTRDLLEVDVTALATADDAAETITWKALSGFRSQTYPKGTLQSGRGTAGRAIAARKTVVLEGIGERSDLPANEFRIHQAEQVRNAMGVPLMLGERIVGVLIAGYRSNRRFTEQQIKLAEALAAQAGIAVENGRLFTRLAAANERLLEVDRMKTEMIAELSTPVLPIRDRILLAPIVGTLDSERAAAITDAVLQKTVGGGAAVVILDITGVRVIDSDAAQHLRNTVAAIRILGAHCIVTGVGAAVAQTMVHLGLTFKDIKTRRKLSDGLDLALDILADSDEA